MQKIAKKSPSGHHCTTSERRYVLTIGKNC